MEVAVFSGFLEALVEIKLHYLFPTSQYARAPV